MAMVLQFALPRRSLARVHAVTGNPPASGLISLWKCSGWRLRQRAAAV